MSSDNSRGRFPSGALRSLSSLALLAFVGYGVVEWVFNRITVPVGSSLMLTYKGPFLFGKRLYPEDGLADLEKGEIGVVEKMPGPGRHFYCPIWWVREVVADFFAGPNQYGSTALSLQKYFDAYARAARKHL